MKKERYDLHVELCVKGGHQYEFPSKDAAQLNFSNYSNIVPASFVMYCDLEAMITKEVKVNRGKIQTKSVHVPVAVGAITVCRPIKGVWFSSYDLYGSRLHRRVVTIYTI